MSTQDYQFSSTLPHTPIGLGYQSLGVIDPNFASAIAITTNIANQKTNCYNSFVSSDMLTGFFKTILSENHIKLEIPAVTSRTQDPITEQTLKGYINHIKAAGDGIIDVLGTYRVNQSGSKQVHVAEDVKSCNQHGLTANTSFFNAAFSQNIIKQQVNNIGFLNQSIDLWQSSTKFTWIRAEKHLQLVSATASIYTTEAYESIHKNLYESAKNRISKGDSWKITLKSKESFKTNYDLNVYGSISIDGESLNLFSEKELLIKAKEAYLEATELYISATKQLKLAAESITLSSTSACRINGSQIFLGNGFSSNKTNNKKSLKESATESDKIQPEPPQTLANYSKSKIKSNQPNPVTVIGNQTINNPTI